MENKKVECICKFCRAICNTDTADNGKFCFLEFDSKHSFLFDKEDWHGFDEQKFIRKNLLDWKNWLRENRNK